MSIARSERLRTPARSRTIEIGSVSISYVSDGYVELDPSKWYQTKSLPGSPIVNASGYLVASVGSVVVKERDGSVIIDAGFGPVMVAGSRTHPSLGGIHGGSDPAFTSRFREPVLALAVTHAHDDHVGWFKTQYSHLLENEVNVGLEDVARFRQLTGRTKLRGLRGGEQLSASVRAISTPGHTAGHMSYIVESDGQRAIIFGDVFHNPLQFEDTALTPWSDELPDAARQSRRVILEMLHERGTVGIGYHFGDMVFGRLEGTEWAPLETN